MLDCNVSAQLLRCRELRCLQRYAKPGEAMPHSGIEAVNDQQPAQPTCNGPEEKTAVVVVIAAVAFFVGIDLCSNPKHVLWMFDSRRSLRNVKKVKGLPQLDP